LPQHPPLPQHPTWPCQRANPTGISPAAAFDLHG
jgi:hypothetical protein